MDRHFIKIQAKIKSILNTNQFPIFMLWLLEDDKYGALNRVQDPDTINSMNDVIHLYREWINTGKKPNEDRWIEAKEIAWECIGMGSNVSYNATVGASAHEDDKVRINYSAQAVLGVAYDYDSHASITRVEVEKEQLAKLDELIDLNSLANP